ncbi:hypothetical protein FS837_005127 [Tulasnella sp. UAMH 9824]|nr:hypothetical protein FS837_005127 [Tulasnella sp. UAMH 9824]
MFYNNSIGRHPSYLGVEWQFITDVRTEHVWDAFALYGLLDYHTERDECLVLPHTGAQQNRFDQAMVEQNERMILLGIGDVAHRCKKCAHIFKRKGVTGDDEWVMVNAAVTDGVTIGHPCCASHNCKNPLESNRDRFCRGCDYKKGICSVKGCENLVEAGRQTCTIQSHRAGEERYFDRGQAMFELRARLERARVSNPTNSFGIEGFNDVEGGEEDVSDDDVHKNPKSDEGNKKTKAQFGRKRTHNEQVMLYTSDNDSAIRTNVIEPM